MKKFSLKKITAAVSAAAMIATMGTTAFAYEKTTNVETEIGNGINITKVQCLDTDKDGIFDVEIGYTTTSAHELGATMLTYGNAGNTSLTTGDFTNTTDMKIVGVDQSESVGANENKSFNFKVSAIPSTTNSYYLKRGVTALVAISGSGATAKSVAQLQLDPLTATSATMTETSVPVNYFYGDNDEAILAAVKAAIKGKTVNVAAVGTAVDEKTKKPLESYTAVYTLAGTEEVTKENNTYSVTIPNTATFDADSADASCIAIPTDGIKAEIPVTLTAKAWTGTGLALREGVTSVSINKNDIASDDTDATKAVKKALEGILYITDTDGRSAKVTNVLADGVITVEKTGETQYNSTLNGEQDLKFKVTAANAQSVKENTESEVIATLESGTIETLDVKVKALGPGEFFVKDVKALKNGAEVTIPDQAYGTNLQDALNSALDGAKILVYGENGESEEWSLATGEWDITNYSDTVETEQPNVTAKKKIVAPENSKGKIDSGNDIELPFTFKVLAKPVGILGDVDKSGEVDDTDVFVLARYVDGWNGYDKRVKLELSDVDDSGEVDDIDVFVLARHVDGWNGYESLPYKK